MAKLALLVLCAVLAACAQSGYSSSQRTGETASASGRRGGPVVQAAIISFEIERGAVVGTYYTPEGCSGEEHDTYWGALDEADLENQFVRAANRAMKDAGFPVGRVDADARSSIYGADYVVAAAVMDLGMALCERRSGNTAGIARISVDWVILPIVDGMPDENGAVWIETEGMGEDLDGTTRDWSRILALAFADAAERFAADPDLARTVAKAPTRSSERGRSGPSGTTPALPQIGTPETGTPKTGTPKTGTPKTGTAPTKTAPAPSLSPIELPASGALTGNFASNSARIQSAVVVIDLGDGSFGSGFYITADGYILTNAHVVEGYQTVTVIDADGTRERGQVLRQDEVRDVALVKVSRRGATPLPLLLSRQPIVGEEVYAVGAPLDQALTGTVTKGIVSSLRSFDGVTLIQADVDIQPGNSGGPLTDGSGNVLGISEAVLGTGTSIGLNFFIPIGDALRALNIVLR